MGVWGAALQGVLSVDSSIQQGIAENKQAAANAKLANDAAADALIRGTAEAGKLRQAGSEAAAEQAFAFSNSGVDASVGTAANVQAGTRAKYELGALTAENNAAREAWGYKKHGIAYQTQAAIADGARNRQIAGTTLGAIGSAFNAYGKSGSGLPDGPVDDGDD